MFLKTMELTQSGAKQSGHMPFTAFNTMNGQQSRSQMESRFITGCQWEMYSITCDSIPPMDLHFIVEGFLSCPKLLHASDTRQRDLPNSSKNIKSKTPLESFVVNRL